MNILVLYAKVRIHDGSFVSGPVTTNDFQEFLFRGTSTSLDIYFSLGKDETGWHFLWGPSVPPPDSLIQQVGQQIDQELVTK